jgi:hypothetical protein
MKIPFVCALLFVGSVAAAWAQQSAPAAAPNPRNDQAQVQKSPAGDDRFLFKIRPDRETPVFAESFCAYIRTYRVRREYANSDVVTPAGYTACTPSQRFELRSAVATASDSTSLKGGVNYPVTSGEKTTDVEDDAK